VSLLQFLLISSGTALVKNSNARELGKGLFEEF
jgi:hypothetical protein